MKQKIHIAIAMVVLGCALVISPRCDNRPRDVADFNAINAAARGLALDGHGAEAVAQVNPLGPLPSRLGPSTTRFNN